MVRRVLWIALLLGSLLALAGCEAFRALPLSAKPHVHVLIAIRADNHSTASFDFGFGAVIDRPLGELLRRNGSALLQEAGIRNVRVTTAKWYGREYNRLQVEFESLEELSSFFNSPQLLSALLRDLLASFDADMEIPPLFDAFDIWQDQGTNWHYRVSIKPSAALRDMLQFAHLEWHIRFPCAPSDHNASSKKGNTLTWDLNYFAADELKAETVRPITRWFSRGADLDPQSGSGDLPSWLPWALGGVLAVVGLGAVALLVILASRKRGPPTPHRSPGSFGPPPPPPGRRR